jgi:cytochrome P450
MRKTVTAALEEAGRAGLEEATADHLVIAITQDPACAGVFVFEHAGIDPRVLSRRLAKAPAGETPTGAASETGQGRPTEWSERAQRLSSSALHLLDVAGAEADRLGDRHVGTEHVALSLALANGSVAATALTELGFTHARGVAALRAWHRQGMPRLRRGLAGKVFATPPLRQIMRPIQWLSHRAGLAWNVFVRKSLGHPGFVTNPYPLYRRLRETEPVRKDPIAPVYVITRYAETFTMLRDPRFKKDPFAGERLPPVVREQLNVSAASAGRASAEMVSMLFLDPPEHTRVRGIFTKAFTPKRLESLRPRIQQITDKRLDYAETNGDGKTIELMRDLAAPLPVTIIAELLGFPPEDFSQIKKWSDEMAEALALNPTPAVQARAYQARQEIRAYFEGIVEKLKESPGENLISALVSGEAYGERGERLNPDERFSNSILLLAAGHETTTNLIGNGVLALLQHPDQLRALREHTDELIESAVEELLRFDPPVQWTSRVAGENVTLAGVEIERGSIILASVAAANRDPAVFVEPDRLDLRRKDNKHLSFGTGIHFCLGATLARWEAQVAIGTLITRYPKLRLATRKLRWRKGITFRGLHELPLYVR